MKIIAITTLTKKIALSFLIFAVASSAFAFKEADPDDVTAKQTQNEELTKEDINRFTNAIGQIKEFYVKKTNDKKLLEDAIRGMLDGLDPHSEYLDKDAYKTLLMATSGKFAGLGVEVTSEYGVLKVISPIDDTPAAKAGIKPGDYIVAINKKYVNNMTINESVKSMRGKKGTSVILTVIRKGEKKPLTFKLKRETIQIASVKSRMLENGFGYVRISEFQEPTAELMIKAIKQLKKQTNGKLHGLVLDLRNNPGGLLESAVAVSDALLDNKKTQQYNNLIVYAEGRFPHANFRARTTNSADIINGAPLVILVNAGSASASEIVAGALQDYRRAIVVGLNSFGKGSVQTIMPLDDTHAIKLTTALYHTPSGRLIQNKGVRPDVRVEDLKIIESKKVGDTMLTPIREFELKGHLSVKSNTDNTVKSIENSNTAELASSDFQLYQALKVLKTIVMVENTQTINTQKSMSASNKT